MARPAESFELVRPTDFEILWILKNGHSLTTPIVADLADRKTDYISARLGDLSTQGLATSIHEVSRCKVYRITPAGAVALAHATPYNRKHKRAFANLAGRVLSYLFAVPNSRSDQVSVTSSPVTWHPMMVVPSRDQLQYLTEIQARQPVAQQDFFDTGDSYSVIDQQFYSLQWYGLITAADSGYILTNRGQEVLSYVTPLSEFNESDYVYFRLQAQLEAAGVVQVPAWYDPSAFVASSLSPELSSDVPDFTE